MSNLRDTNINGNLSVFGNIIWGEESLKDKILSRSYLKCDNNDLMIGNSGYLYEFIGGVGMYVGWALLSEISANHPWENIYSSYQINLGLEYPQQFLSVTYANVRVESPNIWTTVGDMYNVNTVPSFYAISAAETTQKNVYVSFLTIGFLG